MGLYTGLIYCLECKKRKDNEKVIMHKFKGRKERNNINYRCNYRLKYGIDKCDNDAMVEEQFLNYMIGQQLDVINMKVENVDIKSVVKEVLVSKTRIEIFFRNLPIKSCYYDSKMGKMHFDTLKD